MSTETHKTLRPGCTKCLPKPRASWRPQMAVQGVLHLLAERKCAVGFSPMVCPGEYLGHRGFISVGPRRVLVVHHTAKISRYASWFMSSPPLT